MKRYIKQILKETLFYNDIRLLLENFRLDKIKQIVNKRLPEKEQLTDDQLETIIKADPTTHGDNAGKYSEWLIKAYINLDNNYRKRFFEDLYKYTGALETFHDLKTRNKIEEKDINKIDNLQELKDAIEDENVQSIIFGFPDTRKLEASGDVEVIFRDPEIHIYWTKTHRANTILGSDTFWCTVPKESSAFDEYNQDGPIFILYDNNNFERYQYHFESNQFMNEYDHDDDSLLDDDLIKQAFIDFAIKHNNIRILLYYDEVDLISEDLIIENIKKGKSILDYIPDHLMTEKVCLAAVTRWPSNIVYISEERRTYEIYLIVASKNGWILKTMPEEYITEELCLAAVSNNGLCINDVPTERLTDKICFTAVSQNGLSIGQIPEEFMTEELCVAAVSQNSAAIDWIYPEKFKTKKVVDFAIKKYIDTYKEK